MNTTMPRIKCAHCKDYHGSIDEVRFCAANHHARTTFAGLPVDKGGQPRKVTVPDGHYAIRIDGGSVKFYRVTNKYSGPWRGRVFVDMQAGDDYYPTYNRDQRDTILSIIAADVKAASIRYGQEIGRCGVCNRTLTNDVSIAAGIGPVCAGRMGW